MRFSLFWSSILSTKSIINFPQSFTLSFFFILRAPFFPENMFDFFHYITRTYFRQLVISVNSFPKLYHISHHKNRPVHKRGHFFHLYSDSYKSAILTSNFSAIASRSFSRGLVFSVAISCNVERLMPVKIANLRYDIPFSCITSFKSTFTIFLLSNLCEVQFLLFLINLCNTENMFDFYYNYTLRTFVRQLVALSLY